MNAPLGKVVQSKGGNLNLIPATLPISIENPSLPLEPIPEATNVLPTEDSIAFPTGMCGSPNLNKEIFSTHKPKNIGTVSIALHLGHIATANISSFIK